VIGEVVRLVHPQHLHQQFSELAFSQEFAEVSSSNTSISQEGAE
jgi:hypothetical protein